MEPGDVTHYEFVAVQMFGFIEVVVLNDSFFDKITFVPENDEPYRTFRGDKTNPWTIKAAKNMRDRLIAEDK